jgi:hypothetical protein
MQTKVLFGILEGRRQPGRHGNRWEDNMNIDLEEIGSEDMDWSHLTQNRGQWRALVNESSGSIEGKDFFDQVNKTLLLRINIPTWAWLLVLKSTEPATHSIDQVKVR